MKAITLITDALFELGVVADRAVPTASQATRGLRTLNRLLDRWNLDMGVRIVETRVTFTWAANQASRTIGPSGQLVGQRPVVEPRMAIIPAGDTQEIPLNPLSRADYAALITKTLTSTYPSDVRYEPTPTNGTLTVWPVPTTAPTLVVYDKTALTAFADLNTDYVLTEGFEEALLYNLAKRLANGYGVTVSAELADDAGRSLGDLRRAHDQGPPPLRTDPLAGGGRWNILTGRYS